LGSEGRPRGEPAKRVAYAATDVHHANRAGETTTSNSAYDGRHGRINTGAVVELLPKTLHFPMNGDQEAVDFERIENALARGENFDGANGLPVKECSKYVQNILFAHRQPRKRMRIVAYDEVGEFRLRGIPGCKHDSRLMHRADRGKRSTAGTR